MSTQVIPLTTAPNQTFSVNLVVNGSALTLNLTLSYLYMTGWWQMQVADAQNNVLIASIPLITGYYPAANLLAQYQYLNIGSAYLLNTSNDPNDYPGETDLQNYTLVWGDNV